MCQIKTASSHPTIRGRPRFDDVTRLLAATALIAVLLGASSSAIAQRSRVRAEGIAVVVGGAAPGPGVDTIFRSDIEFRARMRMSERSSLDEAMRAPVPNALMRATMNELIGEMVIAREALRVRVASPSAADVARERLALERACGGTDALAELARMFGLSSAALEAIALRRAQVNAFLAANLEGATRISDAEVERLFAAHENPYPNRPLEEVREPLRAYLAQQALERTVERWVGVLRARTTMRVLANYED